MAAFPASSRLHVEPINRRDSGPTGTPKCHVLSPERAARLASLSYRVDSLRLELTIAKQRQRTLVGLSTEWLRNAIYGSFEIASANQRPQKFGRVPEVVLTSVAFFSLFFVPNIPLDDLSQLLTVMLIPSLVTGFVFGGAALWRAFRHQ